MIATAAFADELIKKCMLSVERRPCGITDLNDMKPAASEECSRPNGGQIFH